MCKYIMYVSMSCVRFGHSEDQRHCFIHTITTLAILHNAEMVLPCTFIRSYITILQLVYFTHSYIFSLNNSWVTTNYRSVPD